MTLAVVAPLVALVIGFLYHKNQQAKRDEEAATDAAVDAATPKVSSQASVRTGPSPDKSQRSPVVQVESKISDVTTAVKPSKTSSVLQVSDLNRPTSNVGTAHEPSETQVVPAAPTEASAPSEEAPNAAIDLQLPSHAETACRPSLLDVPTAAVPSEISAKQIVEEEQNDAPPVAPDPATAAAVAGEPEEKEKKKQKKKHSKHKSKKKDASTEGSAEGEEKKSKKRKKKKKSKSHKKDKKKKRSGSGSGEDAQPEAPLPA
ncbi:hypothetical protein L596_009035 [Steinernema carpocapsae]|uniref:Uncharacterized protein n=1 Tax=Steinernema carpocapsae TaxID=34508 RepID=A0A4U5PFE1_STECR|nr:hypothetical protein L596_009035 [Steinernema carpocapsae]